MKNKYTIIEDYVEIELTNARKTLISLSDLDKVDSHKGTWGAYTHRGLTYVQSKIPGTQKHMKLARFIMDAPKGTIVDHIDRKTLDNRRHNLRITDLQQNRYNSEISKNNTSGHTGVIKTKYNTWRAQIWNNGKNVSLGTYKTIGEAVEARQKAENKYYE